MTINPAVLFIKNKTDKNRELKLLYWNQSGVLSSNDMLPLHNSPVLYIRTYNIGELEVREYLLEYLPHVVLLYKQQYSTGSWQLLFVWSVFSSACVLHMRHCQKPMKHSKILLLLSSDGADALGLKLNERESWFFDKLFWHAYIFRLRFLTTKISVEKRSCSHFAFL